MTNLNTFNASCLKTSISDLTHCCTEPFICNQSWLSTSLKLTIMASKLKSPNGVQMGVRVFQACLWTDRHKLTDIRSKWTPDINPRFFKSNLIYRLTNLSDFMTINIRGIKIETNDSKLHFCLWTLCCMLPKLWPYVRD